MTTRIMNKFFFCAFILSAFCINAFGQQDFDPPNQKTSLLPAPGTETRRATSVENFQGVNYFNGQANIYIPIYQQKYGSVDLNLGIGYSSSGIPLAAFPSEVGSGWELSTGFSLTRIINGSADDDLDQGDLYIMDNAPDSRRPAECRQRVSGFVRNSSPIPLNAQSSGIEIKNYYMTSQDPEQDVFALTLNGQSVKFVIGKNKQVFTLSPSDWKIEFSENSSFYSGYRNTIPAGSYFDKFTITDEHGNKYYFESLSFSRNFMYNWCTYEAPCPTLVDLNNTESDWAPTTEWKIRKILTYEGLEVNFNYTNILGNDTIGEIRCLGRSDFRSVTETGNEYCYVFPYTTVSAGARYVTEYKPYLESIIMPDGASLKFFYRPEPRKDAAIEDTWARSYPLGEIRLQRFGYPTTFYKLFHSYFASDNPNGFVPYTNNYYSWGNQYPLRLKLDSILITPDVQNHGYRFEYDLTNRLYNRMSASIDHWGYFNGAAANKSLLRYDPSRGHQVLPMPYGAKDPYDGDRDAHAPYVTTNMLNKITFGDGSSVQYNFEASEGRYFDFYNLLESTSTVGGGARIQSIILYDGISHASDIVKRFEYKLDNGTSSGILFNKPNYDKPFNCHQHGNTIISTNTSLATAYGFTKNGSPVGYSQVTVFNGQNGEGGKEVYNYTNLVDNGQVNIIPGVAPPEPPYANKQFIEDWNIGLLKNKKTYDANGTLVAEDAYEYTSGFSRPETSQLPYFKSFKFDIKRGDPRGFTNKTCNLGIAWDYYKEEYYPYKGYSAVSKMTSTDFRSGQAVASIVQYFYDEKAKLIKELTKGSDGKFTEKRYYRAYNYDTISANPYLNYLARGNRQSEIVREDRLIRESASAPNKYVSSTIKYFTSAYLDPANGIYRVEPGNIYKLKSATPLDESVLGSGINPAQSVPSNGYYYQDAYNFYNSLGLQSMVNKNGHVSATLYDKYNVIATAESATDADIAYTSFENNADAQGGWLLETSYLENQGYSGTHSATMFRNDIVLQKGLQSNRTYNISMWVKQGIPVITFNSGPSLTLTSSGETTANGWTYYYGSFTGKSSCRISSGSQVDEVRLHPAGSTMKTYTYQPLSGLQSECNEQSSVTNYTYDLLGRLIEITDKDHKIIKQFQYGTGTQN